MIMVRRRAERSIRRISAITFYGMALLLVAGCWSPRQYREKSDQVAQKIIHQKQQEALGRTNSEAFTVERPAETLRRRLLSTQELPTSSSASYGSHKLPDTKHEPEKDYPEPEKQGEPIGEVVEGKKVRLSLEQALQVAARNSREYQSQKEQVYRAALNLDLEIDQFRNTYQGLLDSIFSANLAGDTVTGVENTGEGSVTRRLKSGASLTSRIIVDLAKLLSNSGGSAVGLAADASITVPLLQGAGRHVVTEPLTQAERDVLYAIWEFERFKREFVVKIVSQYYETLQAQDQVANARNNYRNQVLATRRTRAMLKWDKDQGRAPGDLDQARSSELGSRNNWITAKQQYTNSLDRFKIQLGLPTDSGVVTDESELEELTKTANKRLQLDIPTLEDLRGEKISDAEAPIELEEPSPEDRGPLEIPEDQAISLALTNRLDLLVAREQVYDAQRQLYITADRLKPSLNLVADASFGEGRSLGSADLPNADLRPEEGGYSGGLQFDLPFERTAERNAYRQSYIGLEQAVRGLQSIEDRVKQDIRLGLRALVEQRESYRIQIVARRVANRRVERTRAMQEEGRQVSARDINEALAAQLEAENQVTSALIDYRLSELELQRDMGVLKVGEDGLYQEFNPETLNES